MPTMCKSRRRRRRKARNLSPRRWRTTTNTCTREFLSLLLPTQTNVQALKPCLSAA